MSFKCNIGLHTWDGCQCSVCGKTRDTGHDFSEDCCKCSRCGKEFDEDLHDWSQDCEKCAKCGKTREDRHSWQLDCEKCSECGIVRSNMHKFRDGICIVCGKGTFQDPADGTSYKVRKIGEHVVMAENYARRPKEGNYWAYEDDEHNRSQYGFLYDWDTAKAIEPAGWHLPTKSEWEALCNCLGGHEKKAYEQLKAGGKSGFESVFGGERNARGAFNSLGASAYYWSATEEGEQQAWLLKIGAYTESAELKTKDPCFGLSVRFIRDK